jgi:hypothetical protein
LIDLVVAVAAREICVIKYLPYLIFPGDVDDIFLPSPCDLLVNLQACKEQVSHSVKNLKMASA